MGASLLSLALLAGALAAFNPCGFAMLPAYLSLLVASPGASADGTSRRRAATARALRSTGAMTLGFVAVFGVFAAVIAPLAFAVEPWLPVVTIVIGAVLLVLGVRLVTGHELGIGFLNRRGIAPGASLASQVGYGTTYALASLSCTVGPFLAVVAGALRAGGPGGVVVAMLAYALGMGAVVGVLAVVAATATATSARAVTVRLRRFLTLVPRLSGVLLLAAGAYVAWYGWFELRVLAGASSDDPVVGAAVAVQSALTQWLASLGATGIVVALALVAAAALWVGVGALRGRAARGRDASSTDSTDGTRLP